MKRYGAISDKLIVHKFCSTAVNGIILSQKCYVNRPKSYMSIIKWNKLLTITNIATKSNVANTCVPVRFNSSLQNDNDKLSI